MTCFILATGPSQNQRDVDLVRGRGIVIAVNRAIDLAPWADILYASDVSWWRRYNPEWFTGEKLTINEHGEKFGATVIPFEDGDGFGRSIIRTGYNSGFQALNLAIVRRYDPIILLGYDFQRTGGRAHCHEDYPEGMGNAGPVALWLRTMERAAGDTHGCRVINCSRETAITGFPRMSLEECLDRLDTDGLPAALADPRLIAGTANRVAGDSLRPAGHGDVAGSKIVSQ